MTSLFPAGAADVLYLVDLSSYVLRAYHAVSPLSSPTGEPTHAVHGTVSMLERLLKQRQPALFAIAMDSGRETFRKEIYSEYKAQRPPSPPDLRVQLQRCGEIVRAYRVAVFQQPGVEADDLIATLVRQANERGLKVVIVGADKDLMQLVSDRVVLWDTMRDRVFGVTEVEERFGVHVAQLRDLLALTGDTSDNIPGVPSVGPKTAQELLNEFGTLEGIYAHLDDVKRKKLRETLALHHEAALLSQRLVTLKDDCPLEFDLRALQTKPRDLVTLRSIYSELGFQRQLALLDAEAKTAGPGEHAEILGDAARAPHVGPASEEAPLTPNTETREPSAPSTALPPETITTLEALRAFAILAQASGTLAVECHTVGSGGAHAIVGLGLAASPERSAYLPLAHRVLGTKMELSASVALRELEPIFRSSGVTKLAYDVKRELVTLARHGLAFEGRVFDVQLALYLDDAETHRELGDAAHALLGRELQSYDAVTEKRRGHQLHFDEVAVDAATPYAASRVEALVRLREPLADRLADAGLTKLYEEVELPLAFVLADLEQSGILLDSAKLRGLGEHVNAELVVLEKKAIELAGREFNVHSPRQLEALLFDELGLKSGKRTKTSRSTDAETLEALTDVHPLPGVVLEIRQLAKLRSTYIETLPNLVDPKTGRVHSRWEQAVAATGRLSSTDPNLQNIPIRTVLGRKIREAFIAPPGFKLVSADYSQIELRVLAHLSEDPMLISAFREGQDIHTRTAMEVFEVSEAEVTRELRTRAKAVNFGVIYGQGDLGLAKSLGISRMEAGNFIAAYFRKYRGVQRFMSETLASTRQAGVVQSLLGRRRLLPDIHSSHRARRLAAERIAMNMPIQGTAADLLKLAMLALAKPVTPGTRMLLTVHDELVFEVPDAERELASERIRQAMESVYALRVPLVVDVGYGENWNAAH